MLDHLKYISHELGKSIKSIECIILVGSYARNEQRSDSDIDLVLISDEKEELLTNAGWTRVFGNPITPINYEYYGEITSLRLYTELNEYEIGVGTMKWIELPLDFGTRKTLEDGYIVLYEKDNVLRHI